MVRIRGVPCALAEGHTRSGLPAPLGQQRVDLLHLGGRQDPGGRGDIVEDVLQARRARND
jgi:hypothetical protein